MLPLVQKSEWGFFFPQNSFIQDCFMEALLTVGLNVVFLKELKRSLYLFEENICE